MRRSDRVQQKSRNEGQGLRLIASLMLAEVVVCLVTDSDTIRAAVVSTVLAIFLFFAFAQACLRGQFKVPKATGATSILLLLFAAGMYGTLLGLVRRNDYYYLAADVYHWWIELFFVAYITFVVARHISSASLIKSIVSISFILGAVTICFVILGTLGLTSAGGHMVAAISIWRLDAGRGFPMLLLLVLVATFRSKEPLPVNWRTLRTLAMLLLLVTLFLTLKRAMWLTFVCASMFIVMRKVYLKLALVFAPIVVVAVLGFVVVYPNAALALLVRFAQSITYNPNYTIEDTLGERIQQIVALVPYMKNLVGYGFGAQFYTYWPGQNTFGFVHYIHNLYVYTYLQTGIGGVLSYAAAYWLLLKGLWKQIGSKSDYEWMARGCFAATMAVLVTGLTMNSAHTVFNGLIFGLGLVIAVSARQRAASIRRISPPGQNLADAGQTYS